MNKKGYNRDKMSSKHKLFNTQILLIIILGLAFIFRFYRLNDWLIFGMDQENEAFIIQNIVSGKHYPLIGLSVGDTGLYRGPIFLYLYSIPYVLFSGNPVGGAIVASFLGVITTYFVFVIGKKMMSERIGLFASIFYAGSFLVSYYDRQYWNPSVIPLLSLIIGYLSWKILTDKTRLFPLLIFLFGIAIHAHFSILIFLPIILYLLVKKRRYITKRLFLSIIVIFFITQLPLILFDLKHNFLISKAGLSLFASSQSREIQYSTLLSRTGLAVNTLGRFFALPASSDLFVESGQCKELGQWRKNAFPEGMILLLVLFSIFILWCKSRRIWEYKSIFFRRIFTQSKQIVFFIFFLTFTFVLFYNRTIFEYYFLFLFPWIAIVLGICSEFIYRRHHGDFLVLCIILLYLIFNFISLATANFSYSFADKLQSLQFVKRNIQNEPFALEALGECPRFGGYRYLFERFVSVPNSSYMDSYFAWLYPEKIKREKAKKIVLLSMIDDRLDDSTLKKWQEEKLHYLMKYQVEAENKFGKIHIYILSTSI